MRTPHRGQRHPYSNAHSGDPAWAAWAVAAQGVHGTAVAVAEASGAGWQTQASLRL